MILKILTSKFSLDHKSNGLLVHSPVPIPDPSQESLFVTLDYAQRLAEPIIDELHSLRDDAAVNPLLAFCVLEDALEQGLEKITKIIISHS